MRPRLLTLLFACFVVLAPAAHADQASKLAKAREYFALTHADELSRQVVDQVLSRADQSLIEELAGQTLTPKQQEIKDSLLKRLRTVLEGSVGFAALEPEYAKLIADTYSEEELDQLVAFYGSPAGRALVAKTPELLKQTNALVQERLQSAMPELQKAMKEASEQIVGGAPAPANPHN
jgi:uncharacterized protein